MDRDHPILPIVATMAAVASLSLMDALMKGAALAAGVYSATLLRAAFSCGLAAPIWLARRGRWPNARTLRLHLLRGVISAFMALTFFYAITKLPIAEAIAISFIAPLVALYLAALILKERIRREAIHASILGFGGTIVIVWGRLGSADSTDETWLGVLAILVSALLYALNFIVIRLQSQAAGPAEVATFHGGVSAAIIGVAAPWLFVFPGQEPLALIAGAAILTVAGAMLLAWAYARAEAQTLVPLEYSGFLWAVVFGWLLFAEEVTTATLAGTALIILGSYVASRSRVRGKVPPAEAATK